MLRKFALFAVVAFLAVASVPAWGQATLSNEAPLDLAKLMAPTGYCRCGAPIRTPTETTAGTNCSSATASLISILWDYVTCIECAGPTLTSSCSTSGGEDPVFLATGYFTYRCYQLGGGCQIP